MKKKYDFIKTDYKNRFNRQLWLEDRRRDLIRYFDNRNIANGKFGGDPYWCVVPRTSIWQIPSLGTPGFDGWYGIAGDHPTDVVPLNYFDGNPRKILDHFVNKWLRAAHNLQAGEDYGDFNIDSIEDRPVIGRLIEDRAKRLKTWVDTEDLWHGVTVLNSPIFLDEEQEQPETKQQG